MNHQAIEAQAANFLEQRDTADWNTRSEQDLNLWLQQSPAHRAAYWRLKAAWQQAERLAALKAPALKTVPPVSTYRPTIQHPRSNTLFRAAAALCVIMLIGAATLMFWQPQPSTRTYVTAIGERRTLHLPDGSSVEMNTDTILHVARDNARKVWLDRGEAYFDIVHNDTKPFIVTMGDHRVVDLGTKFLIRRDAGRSEVALIEGAAQLETADKTAGPAILSPGDVAYANETRVLVKRGEQTSIKNALAWRAGMVVFERATLAEAASELNRYNQKQIIILDPAAARLTIHGRFPATDTAAIVNVAQDVFNLRIQQKDNEILISR